MYNGKKILAIIPARSGSKGVPNKNIIDIDGRPLIDFTIKEALKSQYIDNVIVSTDSELIAEVAKKCGAEVPFLRPTELAQDQSKIIDVMLDLIEKLSKKNRNYDYVILLQPTQPLRKTLHIDEAIAMICENQYESLISINEVEENPVLVRKIGDDGCLESILNLCSTIRRQDFPKFFKVNGAIYINKIDGNFDRNTSLNDNKYPYIMEKKYDVDIDEPFDLEIFKLKLKILESKGV